MNYQQVHFAPLEVHLLFTNKELISSKTCQRQKAVKFKNRLNFFNEVQPVP